MRRTACSPPPGWGVGGVSVLRWAKKAGKFYLGAPGRIQSCFFVSGGSQERSWTRLGVDLARRDEKDAPGVDLGSHFGSKNDVFFRIRSICGCYRVFCMFSLLFFSFISACLAVRAKGRKAKFDTLSERKRVFSRCTLAPALPQGRQPMVNKTST